jgi:hypothetical protein
MGFDIGKAETAERMQARWRRYTGDGATIHCKIKPRDEAAVDALNVEFPQPERITRAGRVREARSKGDQERWLLGYLAAHIEEWDLTADGVKAPIDRTTVASLTDGMRSWIVDETLVDDPRAHEVESPFPDCRPTSSDGSITPP